ncbi:MAG TPA: 50S ribosomal protein L13 [Patescibacteria group bacterium]|nr:50S ribosomal protein L13 [Patescibacteria group bacterium]
MSRKTHKINAEKKVLGRLASQIAVLLVGKHKVDYQPNADNGDIVEVSNVEKMKFTGKKMEQSMYYSYSGYPGGMKKESLKLKLKKDPEFILKSAVYNMLPKNKLRGEMIKRLKFVK